MNRDNEKQVASDVKETQQEVSQAGAGCGCKEQPGCDCGDDTCTCPPGCC